MRAINAAHRDLDAPSASGSPGSSRDGLDGQPSLEEELREDLRIREVRAWLEESVAGPRQAVT